VGIPIPGIAENLLLSRVSICNLRRIPAILADICSERYSELMSNQFELSLRCQIRWVGVSYRSEALERRAVA